MTSVVRQPRCPVCDAPVDLKAAFIASGRNGPDGVLECAACGHGLDVSLPRAVRIALLGVIVLFAVIFARLHDAFPVDAGSGALRNAVILLALSLPLSALIAGGYVLLVRVFLVVGPAGENGSKGIA